MKTSYLFLAPGFEEIEALTPVDVLRRAGMPVKTVSITDNLCVTGANGAMVKADMLLADNTLGDADWLIVPGGMPGATNLSQDSRVSAILTRHYTHNGSIASICASPAVVLAPLGILDGREATCYPGMATENPNIGWIDVDVVSQQGLITANGPATALKFALSIVAAAMGHTHAGEIARGMLYKR